MKKNWLLLLAVILSLLTTAAWAKEKPQQYKEGDYAYIVLNDGTAEIVSYLGEEAVVKVPAEIAGKKVTSIGEEAFSMCYSLERITLPKGVTSIGDGAFKHCTALSSITLPVPC